jgi:hypothetical protein
MVDVVAAGVDTSAMCWRVNSQTAAAERIGELATQPTWRSRMFPDPVLAHRIVWFPETGLLKAEGHPCCDDSGALCPPAEMATTLDRLEQELAGMGVEVRSARDGGESTYEGVEGVSRLDATVNLQTESTVEGLAILAGMAAVTPNAWFQAEVIRQAGGRAIETVSWSGKRVGKVALMYDKGWEQSGQARQRGRLLRPESRTRWPKGLRRGVDEMTPEYVRGIFVKRFTPLWRATEGVKIVTERHAFEQLQEAVENEVISAGQAYRAAGILVAEKHGVKFGERQQQYRNRQLTNRLGLVLHDGTDDEQEVDLHDVMTQVLETDAWERRG